MQKRPSHPDAPAEEQSQSSQDRLEGARGFTVRAIGLAAAVVIVTNLGVSSIELVTGRYLASGIPPIPAVATLAVLVAITPLLRRLFAGRVLGRREILVIYCMIMMAVPMTGSYGIRAFLPRLTVLQYFATPENSFAQYAAHIPSWFAPTSQQQIIKLYEGAQGGIVPWSIWLKPLGLWTLFFVALFITALSMLTLMHRHWAEAERLPFPLVQLPTEMVQADGGKGALGRFFTNPITWVGIGLALIYNAANVGHALNPAVPAIPQSHSLSGFLTERPWTAMSPLYVATHPQYVGFAYLVSQEVGLSIVAFTFLAKALSVGGAMVGYEPAGFPFLQEQSGGGYVAFGLLMLWMARGHLGDIFSSVFSATPLEGHSDEPMPYRWAVFGLVGGSVFFVAWCVLAGMGWTIALAFWLMIFVFGLTYARVRAEAGIPHEFVYPYRLPHQLITNAIGSRGVLSAGGPSTMVIFNVMSFLSRFHHFQMTAAYQTDSLQVAREFKINARKMAGWLLVFFVFGLVLAFWGHFTTFYQIGVNAIEGQAMSSWRTQDTVRAYNQMVSLTEHPTGPNWTATGWAGIGALVTVGLQVLRTIFLRFPLHPVGYVAALAYGPGTHLWFPFLLVWTIKGTVLKLGGIRAYRQLIPAFLGLALGHYVFGGLLWPLVSLSYAPSISARYYTVF